jgi:hypothetical protein
MDPVRRLPGKFLGGIRGKLWGKLIEQARRLPRFARWERGHYEALEARLLDLPRAGSTGGPVLPALPPAPVVREALAAGPDYRCVNPRALDAEDAGFLSAHGLDAGLITANRGLIPAEYLPAKRLQRRRQLGIDTDPDLTAFQLEALDQAAVEAICPVTGRLRRSIHGLLAAQNHPIFYWFATEDDAPAMLLAAGREGRGWIKLYLYLPALGTALLLAEPVRWHGRDEIDELRSHLIAEHAATRRWLRCKTPPQPWLLVDNRQFAHHLWNALSGLERLSRAATAAAAPPRPAGASICAEPWGPVQALFPELRYLTLERVPFPAARERASRAQRLLVRVGATRISGQLIERVRRVAAERVPRTVREHAAALRRRHRPILWVTLRTENRTWVSQVPGLIAIGRHLAADFPDAALIIDGFSIPHGPANAPSAAHKRLIAAERRAARTITEALAGALPVVSLVGRPLFDAVVHAAIADCCFVHHGSLQHKIGWIGNCPGLVHANRTVLTTPMLWEPALTARTDQMPPTYMDAALVRDVPGARRVAKNRWLDDLDNYELDAAQAYAALVPLLRRALEASRNDVMPPPA